MAGIRLIDKQSTITMNFIINALLFPEIRVKLFDDFVGIQEIEAMLYHVRTVIYGVFEQGKPEPIGVVYFHGTLPYRGCTLTAVIFDPEKRKKKKMGEVAPIIKKDFIRRFQIHTITTYVIDPNEASESFLVKLGFEKTGMMKKEVMAGGEYRDVHIYHLLVED